MIRINQGYRTNIWVSIWIYRAEDFIQKKISKLDKYHDGIIGSEVTLKLEKDDNLENKVVEVLLNVKGQEVFAKKNAKKFEEAVDELYDVVKRQLVKIKEKEREC